MWISNNAWDHSQMVNTVPAVTPACRPAQYQRPGLAPERVTMAVVMTTANATMPINGLGKPNSSDGRVNLSV